MTPQKDSYRKIVKDLAVAAPAQEWLLLSVFGALIMAFILAARAIRFIHRAENLLEAERRKK